MHSILREASNVQRDEGITLLSLDIHIIVNITVYFYSYRLDYIYCRIEMRYSFPDLLWISTVSI